MADKLIVNDEALARIQSKLNEIQTDLFKSSGDLLKIGIWQSGLAALNVAGLPFFSLFSGPSVIGHGTLGVLASSYSASVWSASGFAGQLSRKVGTVSTMFQGEESNIEKLFQGVPETELNDDDFWDSTWGQMIIDMLKELPLLDALGLMLSLWQDVGNAAPAWQKVLTAAFDTGDFINNQLDQMGDYGAFIQSLSNGSSFLNALSAMEQASTAADYLGKATEGPFFVIGSIIKLLTNGVENYNEYQSGDINGTRAVFETLIETGVDIGVPLAIGAAIVAFAPVSLPVVAVGAAAGLLYAGASAIVEAITGKDIAEHVADYYCDLAEKVGKGVNRLIQTGGDIINGIAGFFGWA